MDCSVRWQKGRVLASRQGGCWHAHTACRRTTPPPRTSLNGALGLCKVRSDAAVVRAPQLAKPHLVVSALPPTKASLVGDRLQGERQALSPIVPLIFATATAAAKLELES